MNPITSLLVFVLILAGLAIGQWVNLYLALPFLGAAAIVALSLKMIGSTMLAALLSDRKEADEQLKDEIGEKTAPWGISVSSVEIRDVAIPEALQDAMSRQAQAEREKQARVILGSAEAAIAGKFVEAADIYSGHPAALQLRDLPLPHICRARGPGRCGAFVLVPEADPALGEVVGRHLNGDAVPREDADAMLADLARCVGRHCGTVLERHAEHGVGQRFVDHALELDHLFLCHVQPPCSGAQRTWRCAVVDTISA